MAGTVTHTNTAYFVYVALNDDGGTFEVPRLITETDEERALFEGGVLRQVQRLERRRLEQAITC